jgi:hypothetical protein
MINPPQTLEEARSHRYGIYGHAYVDGDCAHEIQDYARHQCLRKNGHGIGGLYCKQHAKIVDKMKDNIKQDSIEYWNDD